MLLLKICLSFCLLFSFQSQSSLFSLSPFSLLQQINPNKRKFCMEDDFIAHEIINSQKKHKKEPLLECRICNKKFPSNPFLRDHFKNEHPKQKPYKCDHCNYQSERIANVNRHKKNKSCMEDDFIAMEDDFIADEIIDSQTRNKKGILMKCRICREKVTGYLELLSHFNNQHPEQKPYKCDHCDYESKLSYSIKLHKQRIHFFETDKRRYTCSFCKKNFFFSSELKKHEKIHFKIKNWKCAICLNFYSSEIALTNHKRSFHTKKYSPCVFCLEVYNTQHTLNQHYKHIHPLENIICEYCGEIFSCKYNVTRHKNLNCGQIFKYKYNLKLNNNNYLGNKNNNHLDRKNIEANSPSHTENPNQEISHLSTSFEENDPHRNNPLDRKNIEANSPSHTENPNQEISHLSTSFEENDPTRNNPPPYETAFNPNFPPSLSTHTQEKEELGNILEDLLDLENFLREKST